MSILKKCFPLPLYFVTALFFSGCHTGPYIPVETPTSGTIHISVDESFKPVIDSQLKVFESSFPDAHILVDYKPEADCLKDIYNDSTRLVIITRGIDSFRRNIISRILQKRRPFREFWPMMPWRWL